VGLVLDRLRVAAVQTRVALGVLDQQRAARLEGVVCDRLPQQPALTDQVRRGAGRGADYEVVAVDQADHRAVGDRERLRALDDQLHDALEVHAGRGDVALRLDQARQPVAVRAQRDLGELALVDVLDHRDRRGRLALGTRLEPRANVHPEDLAVLADVALVVLVELALACHQLAHEHGALREVVGMGEELQALVRVVLGGVAQHLDHRRVDLERVAVGADPHDSDG
jgi:hypothetical protein